VNDYIFRIGSFADQNILPSVHSSASLSIFSRSLGWILTAPRAMSGCREMIGKGRRRPVTERGM
jgi:hypothetical protein